MNSSPESNWDAYYSEKKYDIPGFIVDILWNNYETVLKKYTDVAEAGLVVVELGGADSCLYQRFVDSFYVGEYHIVDNNQVGLDLFQQKENSSVILHNVDLLQSRPQDLSIAANIVFSAGLIEHFSPADTQKIIEFHFALARPAGLVLMSFPTPTAIYWAFRRLLERTGKFPPLFERPIELNEIIPTLRRLGNPLAAYKVWRTILTQLITLSRKS